MAEYEYQMLTFGRDESRAAVRQSLADHAEYGHWELWRVSVFMGGVRKTILRRRIIRVQRTA